ncbi:MAG: hypothetical protein LBJ84_05425 [Oscillospiraceae bacterium]|jgi:hypothetical protein|nr:hypothetical protein [Oscillospiraceae bacterium]
MDVITLALAKKGAKSYTDSVALSGVPVNYPEVVNGTWRVYDPVAGAYIDTGVSAGSGRALTEAEFDDAFKF